MSKGRKLAKTMGKEDFVASDGKGGAFKCLHVQEKSTDFLAANELVKTGGLARNYS